jgi:hypothetical protein
MTDHVSGYADVVDLDTFPIDDLDSDRGRALVSNCREQLAESGVCNLPGFITPAAVATMVALASTLAEKAWHSDQSHTVYFEDVDPDVAGDHPRAYTIRSAKRGIAYDYVPADAPLCRLYESADLTRFIGAVLGKPVLYRSADPLDALQITLFEPTDELGWHFDNSEFSVTVMYQQAEAGGDFLYVPALRSEADENYAGVRRVLLGEDLDSVKTLPSAPGTLAVFQGRNAVHRVSPVEGGIARVNSVLTYGERPDMRLSDLTSLLFYGRTSTPAGPATVAG